MKLDFNDQQLGVIVEALQNTAFKISSPVLAEIQKQVNEAKRPTAE